ncbi:MAG: UPF0175 family protein [Dehalococcoidia bacterium]
MTTRTVELPEDLLQVLNQAAVGSRPESEQVKVALAVHLFQQGAVSVGKAAELSGLPRANFEPLLAEMRIPPVRYDLSDYEDDWQAIVQARNGNP